MNNQGASGRGGCCCEGCGRDAARVASRRVASRRRRRSRTDARARAPAPRTLFLANATLTTTTITQCWARSGESSTAATEPRNRGRTEDEGDDGGTRLFALHVGTSSGARSCPASAAATSPTATPASHRRRVQRRGLWLCRLDRVCCGVRRLCALGSAPGERATRRRHHILPEQALGARDTSVACAAGALHLLGVRVVGRAFIHSALPPPPPTEARVRAAPLRRAIERLTHLHPHPNPQHQQQTAST